MENRQSQRVLAESAERFSSRVDEYDRYRQGYPDRVVRILSEGCGLSPEWVVADIGSGTGLLSEVFLKNGNTVYGVEPNADMRTVAEQQLGSYEGFRSVAAPAEAIMLDDHSVDLVGVGRALHWFDQSEAFGEFRRILKPGGWVVVVRLRRRRSSGFEADYDTLLCNHGSDHLHMHRRRIRLERELEARGFHVNTSEVRRDLNLKQLKGVTLSLTSTPHEGDPGHRPIMRALEDLFREYQRKETVTVFYDLTIHFGRVGYVSSN